MATAKLILKTKKDRSVRRRHPWVFSGAIKKMEGHPKEGDIVEVYANNHEFLGLGHWADGSIAVRIISFEQQEPDVSFWQNKLKNAYDTREALGLTDSAETNTYRLVHAEGDGLPGLIVDWYNGTAVIQAHSYGMYQHLDLVCESLQELYGDRLVSIYDKSAETLPKQFRGNNKTLFGEERDGVAVVENGHQFNIDWANGQKTGFFIDQRENRRLLGQYSRGRTVLNSFCYTGGFSVYALANGASEVHSLDSSAKAMELTDANVALNGYSNHTSITDDAMEHLKDVEDKYDLIVLDPPAFAKHQSARHNAVQGYKRLNAHAMRQIKPGGIIFTFSCSQAVNKELFNHTITAAAISSGRNVRVLEQLHQPADHPVNIYHPESEYLKGLVLRVD